MLDVRKTLGSFGAHGRQWVKLLHAAQMRAAAFNHNSPSNHLKEIRNFGANPGALRMFSYVPQVLPKDRALVVVLHGCKQSAADYDLGTGWSTVADRFGFALLLPEQQRSNNPNGCFNWFLSGDIERGQGEAHSIQQMVEKMVSEHGINPARVFVTGLSAGGAMTSVMLATYPEVFAGGAIVAGLPYGAATNVQEAFKTMYQCPPRPQRAWGDLVRQASQHVGPWPRVSIWHGSADATVIPANASEIVKQWTDVHGLAVSPSAQAMVDGYPRQVWTNAAGDELIESYTITNMAHGTPLATGAADEECGTAGPFLLEVGISSSYHIAKFFGLTAAGPRVTATTRRETNATVKQRRITGSGVELVPSKVLVGEVLEPESDVEEEPKRSRIPRPDFDIGGVITKALRAAGLMKGS